MADSARWDPLEALRGAADGRDHLGLIEEVSPFHGVSGWAVAPRTPSRAVTLEVWAGETMLGTVTTRTHRADVSEILQAPASAGFRFELPGDPPAGLDRSRIGEVINVRVAGDTEWLPKRLDMPRQGRGLKQATAAASESAGLIRRLSVLEQRSKPLCEVPHKTVAENAIGYIEVISVDPAGYVWFSGWMQKVRLLERSAVILDKERFPAGIAYFRTPRSDLPDGATGITGVAKTSWRPLGDPAYFFIDEMRFIRTWKNLRTLEMEQFLEYGLPLWEKAEDGPAQPMLDMLYGEHGARGDAAPATPEKAAIDDLLLIDGFGCVARGWQLGFTREIADLALRLNDETMYSRPGSLGLHARPDLLGGATSHAHLTDRAGFVAAFYGATREQAITRAALQLFYEGGSVANFPLATSVIRRINRPRDADELFRFYPALEDETFFPELATGFSEAAAPRLCRAIPIHVAPAETACILTVPTKAEDLQVFFDSVQTGVGGLPADIGVIILGSIESRAGALELFGALRRSTSRPCSLFLVEQVDTAVFALAEVLQQAEVGEFTFISTDFIVTLEGWEDLVPDGELRFLGAADPASELTLPEASFRRFCWNLADWQDFFSGVPILTFGLGMINVPAVLRGRDAGSTRTMLRLRGGTPSRFAQGVAKLMGR